MRFILLNKNDEQSEFASLPCKIDRFSVKVIHHHHFKTKLLY